jgi:hypothetical protein
MARVTVSNRDSLKCDRNRVISYRRGHSVCAIKVKAAFTRGYMFDEHVRGCVCGMPPKHVETFGLFDEHVCPHEDYTSNTYVEHVRGSRGSRVNKAHGHSYNTIKRIKHIRLDLRNHDRR